MSKPNRPISAFFTTLPGIFFFLLFLLSSSFGRDYWWGTYLSTLIILLIGSLLFGFLLPGVFQSLRWSQPWTWIFVQGLLAWIATLIVLGLLNLTPLCVGQNNGDGHNDLSMCVFMTMLSSVVYTPVYLSVLAVSAWIGHGMLSVRMKTD